jgi:phosphatidylglycerophosphate synthase
VIATTPEPDRLAFKAREIEELVDVYFFRRLGIVFAHLARVARLSPTGLTWIALAVGAVGGAMLALPGYGWIAVMLLVFHGVLDSSDGQLARLTGQTSDFGRLMDGVAGYVTHIAMYLGILVSVLSRDGGWGLLPLTLLAGLSTIVHAQLYDYHRTTYVSIVTNGRASQTELGHREAGLLGAYGRLQRLLAGKHPLVERALAARSRRGHVATDDRERYRTSFLGLVHGWNIMGDNVRRLSIAVAVWAGRPEWFIWAELVPLNAMCLALWLRQQRADGRFLEAG